MNPSHCSLISPLALVSSATHRAPFPISDFDGLDPSWYPNLYSGSILHVCPPALPSFVKKVLPTITVPFKLLTNNSDYTLPKDFPDESEILLQHPLLIHWFSQNWVLDHPKVTRIPIGLDYHSLHIDQPRLRILSRTIYSSIQHPFGWGACKPAILQEQDLLQIKHNSKSFWDRDIKGYANFHFAVTMGYGKSDRPDALNTIPKELVFYEPAKVTRGICWKNMIQYAFVISPHGNGLDCHRTWEALALGCIPIVKSSGIDRLFDDLPVWIVQTWNEVNLENMKDKIQEFRNKTFNYEKLTLTYWKSKIINT